MANTNTVFGANYLMDPLGGSASGKLLPFTMLATDAVACFVGDFVKLSGTAAYSEDKNLGYLPIIQQAAATEVILGVVEGFGVDPDNLSKIYRPASLLRTAWVRVNPYAFFTIQSTGTGALADVGELADITVGAGDVFTGLSGMQLDHSTLGTANGQLRIINIAQNSEVGAYTKFVVQINEHAYKVTTGI